MVNKNDIVLIVMEMDYVYTKKEKKDVRYVEGHHFVYIIRINRDVVNVNQC
jgi:hypothetical protein